MKHFLIRKTIPLVRKRDCSKHQKMGAESEIIVEDEKQEDFKNRNLRKTHPIKEFSTQFHEKQLKLLKTIKKENYIATRNEGLMEFCKMITF